MYLVAPNPTLTLISRNFSHLFILQELEQIEEHYKQETRDLLSTVKRLQDENRKLASSLAAATERDSAFSEDGKYLLLFAFYCFDFIKKLDSKFPRKIVISKYNIKYHFIIVFWLK